MIAKTQTMFYKGQLPFKQDVLGVCQFVYFLCWMFVWLFVCYFIYLMHFFDCCICLFHAFVVWFDYLQVTFTGIISRGYPLFWHNIDYIFCPLVESEISEISIILISAISIILTQHCIFCLLVESEEEIYGRTKIIHQPAVAIFLLVEQ